MSARGPITCDQFDLAADELALGQVDEPTRSRLLVHAANCPHCHSLLESLGTVADRLLLVAPQVEPPAGFESRVLARLDAGVPSPVRRSTRVRWLAAAVVAILVAGAAVALIRRPSHRSHPLQPLPPSSPMPARRSALLGCSPTRRRMSSSPSTTLEAARGSGTANSWGRTAHGRTWASGMLPGSRPGSGRSASIRTCSTRRRCGSPRTAKCSPRQRSTRPARRRREPDDS